MLQNASLMAGEPGAGHGYHHVTRVRF